MEKSDDYFQEQEEDEYSGHNLKIEELNYKLEQYEY